MVTEFKFPDLGEGITEGEIRKWLVKKGDRVNVDQPLAEVETDKAVVEMPSPAAGEVLDIRKSEGNIVKVGEVLIVIGEAGEAAAPVEERKPSVSVVGELPEAAEDRQVKAEPSAVLATPAVRQLAKELGIDLTLVKGSGPEGRITEADVRKMQPSAQEVPAQAPAAPTQAEAPRPKVQPKFDFYGFVERRPLRGIRRITARHMVESLAKAAHVTAMDVVDVTELWGIRERWKEEMKEKGVKLTFMPFIIMVVVEALKLNPVLNASLDDEAEQIVIKKYYNIGYAVATEDGLIVPVVKGADQKGLVELAKELDRLTELALTRKVDLSDLKGSTFTITNYGVFGGTYGVPIINYPDVAILGVGKIADAPMVKDGQIVVRKALHLSLSFDHRVLDGAEAARFVNTLKSYLEEPTRLLLGSRE